MAGTDFFDEDLQNREAVRRGGAVGVDDKPASSSGVARPVSDLNLTRMARHREEVEEQVATSAQELDRLRMRQEELERERRELEELRKKQEDYERGRREIMDRLNKSLIMMEKEQVKAERMVDLLVNTRGEFKGMLTEIEAINEEDWPDDAVRDELTKSLVVLDECRMQYNKSVARIEAVMADDSKGSNESSSMLPAGGASKSELSFSYWLKAGLALSLPLILFLLVAGAVALALFLRNGA